jgi:hypothetical protein
MRPRFALAALVAAFSLAGCDLLSADDSVSGYWEGTAKFSADTVLVDQNARVTADYRFNFAFDLTHDDGLVTGRITATREGYTVYREAGFPADTLYYEDGIVTNDDAAYGTFIEPELEVDVPDGPYSEDLWTFEVVGSRAESSNFILHDRTFFRYIDGGQFTFQLKSDEPFTMRRMNRPEAEAEEGDAKASGDALPEGLRVAVQREAFRAVAADLRQRSEQ